MTEFQLSILAKSTANWFKNPAGITASELASSLCLPHEDVCHAVEALCEAGYGTMNRDAEFVQLCFDLEKPHNGFTQTPIKTHVFFPSRQVLAEAFYRSDLPRQNLSEYVARLHLGAHQYGLVYFDEEILSRYFDHPETYEIEDSLAGGSIRTCSGASEERHLYVQYGKCRLMSGRIAVTAVYKDLARMAAAEQRYWHAHEIQEPSLDTSDQNFQTFLSRTYEGAWVSYPDPIGNLQAEVVAINVALAPSDLFTRSANVHLRMPVEQTYKSYCDCASELYKVIGPDALSQATLKKLLQERFRLAPENFIHQQSKRPLSSLQLLRLLESELAKPNALSGPMKEVARLRGDADHKVLSPDSELQSYSNAFANLCDELTNGISDIRKALVAESSAV